MRLSVCFGRMEKTLFQPVKNGLKRFEEHENSNTCSFSDCQSKRTRQRMRKSNEPVAFEVLTMLNLHGGCYTSRAALACTKLGSKTMSSLFTIVAR